MTRHFLSLLIALLLPLAANGQQRHRGIGCWRTISAQQKAGARLQRARQASDGTTDTPYQGQKKGLVILAEFPDKKFKNGHDKDKYHDILNTEGYTTAEGFHGSAADYFRDQSGGLFELTFDVLGPYTTAHDYKYYGKNDDDGYDLRPEEMIIEMCMAADAEADFTDYDWDGDGEVDEVFVVFAGKGEADNLQSELIWPHMWTMDEAKKELALDGVKINVYACANELSATSKINGIGTFCHEFSHCLGFPDFYDTANTSCEGMDDFDLMDSGCYAGGGFCPVGFSAYEKMACGWRWPIVLSSDDVSIDSLAPMNQGGDSYIIYNDAHPDEYYIIENRQKTGWDKYFPSKGLFICHVDYDEQIWTDNIPNAIVNKQTALKLNITATNDHERMTFFNASDKSYSKQLYPYLQNDSLTATSKPTATLYNHNSQNTLRMQGALLNITQNDGGTVSFRYHASLPPTADAIGSIIMPQRQQAATIYNLQGQKVTTKQKGIYIVNGQKVAVK